MTIVALALAAALSSGPGSSDPDMSCGFPAASAGELPISVDIISIPSLKDAGGLFRVRMALNGRFELAATAQPTTLEDGPAVLIGGSAAQQLFYTLGVRTNGTAALTILDTASGGEVTRMGACRDHERSLQLWLRG